MRWNCYYRLNVFVSLYLLRRATKWNELLAIDCKHRRLAKIWPIFLRNYSSEFEMNMRKHFSAQNINMLPRGVLLNYYWRQFPVQLHVEHERRVKKNKVWEICISAMRRRAKWYKGWLRSSWECSVGTSYSATKNT